MSRSESGSGRRRGVAFLVAAASVLPAPAVAETLYALELNGGDFRVVDRATGADVETISTTVFGSWRGIAMSPVSGILYATDVGSLFTLDTTSGETVEIGPFGGALVRDLTFDGAGQLYGVTGAQGSAANSLHAIDTATGAVTFLVALNGNAGHCIAYDPEEPGTVYHLAAGLAQQIFERVDLGSGAITPIGLAGDPILSPSLGLVYDPLAGLFRFFDAQGRYYALARDGTVTAAGTQNPTVYFGLAFDQPTTQFVIFEDGFESGDTSAWSATVP
ncbi:MAG: hypothetical protein OES32_04870 [Acidobacteriota bacterium]|nr:hypothetical protein [Acidobacteriota bacterium]MDH3522899.1 hypothetical protein [Acidobacteriota bacterium]